MLGEEAPAPKVRARPDAERRGAVVGHGGDGVLLQPGSELVDSRRLVRPALGVFAPHHVGGFGGGDPCASLQTLSLDSALPPPAALHGGTTGNREADADIAAFYR